MFPTSFELKHEGILCLPGTSHGHRNVESARRQTIDVVQTDSERSPGPSLLSHGNPPFTRRKLERHREPAKWVFLKPVGLPGDAAGHFREERHCLWCRRPHYCLD